jgi:hypothetical protein
VLVRADLPIADQIVQAGHACLEAGRCFQPEEGCHLVVLSVSDEIELQLAVRQAEAIGIRCASFFEPDDDMGFTAFCTEPVSDHQRRFFRRFHLWDSSDTCSCPRGPPSRRSMLVFNIS